MDKRTVLFILSLVLVAGCSEENSDNREPGVIEHMTGSEQIKAYRRTKTKLNDINRTLKERNESLE